MNNLVEDDIEEVTIKIQKRDKEKMKDYLKTISAKYRLTREIPSEANLLHHLLDQPFKNIDRMGGSAVMTKNGNWAAFYTE